MLLIPVLKAYVIEVPIASTVCVRFVELYKARPYASRSEEENMSERNVLMPLLSPALILKVVLPVSVVVSSERLKEAHCISSPYDLGIPESSWS